MAKRPIVRNRKEDVGFRWRLLLFSGRQKNRTSHKKGSEYNKSDFCLKIHFQPSAWIPGDLQIIEQDWQG
jgi:hypothetical protein